VPTTDSFTSTATGVSATNATLTVRHTYSLVSTAMGVSATVTTRPFKFNVLGEITGLPDYDPVDNP
jgi:hypothetical protein